MHLRRHQTFYLTMASILPAIVIWMFPKPEAVSFNAWHLFAIFAFLISGVILKPFPMGIMALFALCIATLSQTLSFEEAFSGFGNEIVWLVVFAFFISRGVSATGLGSRLAYKIMSLFGIHTLGLGYALIATDLILAPTVPSVTARIGGIVYPILKSILDLFERNKTSKLGAFLTQTTFQGSTITSAMFLTAMAGNPLIVELARGQNIHISWVQWMMAAILPGLLSLCIVPYVLFRFFKLDNQKMDAVQGALKIQLEKQGKMRPKEWVMCATFVLLMILWILGPWIQVKATVAALLGLAILFLTKILDWKHILEETAAWDTFIWFATFISFASYLSKLGFTSWFGDVVVQHVNNMQWHLGFLVIGLLYFYSHYFFASCVAHIGALYIPFLVVAIAIGTPPVLAALVLAFFSNLMGSLTHYGAGQAPILFSAGHVSIVEWWKAGFLISIINIIIWVFIGGFWWKCLGFW